MDARLLFSRELAALGVDVPGLEHELPAAALDDAARRAHDAGAYIGALRHMRAEIAARRVVASLVVDEAVEWANDCVLAMVVEGLLQRPAGAALDDEERVAAFVARIALVRGHADARDGWRELFRVFARRRGCASAVASLLARYVRQRPHEAAALVAAAAPALREIKLWQAPAAEREGVRALLLRHGGWREWGAYLVRQLVERVGSLLRHHRRARPVRALPGRLGQLCALLRCLRFDGHARQQCGALLRLVGGGGLAGAPGRRRRFGANFARPALPLPRDAVSAVLRYAAPCELGAVRSVCREWDGVVGEEDGGLEAACFGVPPALPRGAG